MARSGVGIDDSRGRPLRGLDERHRRPGRAGRGTGGGCRCSVRSRVRSNGAPAGHRGQPRPAHGADRHQCARPKRPRDRGHRGPVRRNVVPGRDGHVRLRRRLGSRYPADPVHRAGADYQRVRPGGPVGCDCPRHRRLGWCSANDAVAADRRHTVCTARTFVIDCSHVRVGAVRIAGHSRVWIFLARQTLGVTGPQLQFLEHDSFVRTVLAE
ncbi:hypothetical protein NCGM2209_2143 [Mycobacterium tuberculosis NCGM2209]|nr:hypothetical protein NCGM2209_2143 [Mycobacterium tuberculosis NCGM2209]